MSDLKQVVITRTFSTNIERLWRALTTKEDMLKWQSPAGMTTPRVEIDFKVGGKYAIAMKYDESGEVVTVRGEFKIIEKPNRLVYSWKWDTSEEETEVTFLFEEVSPVETMLTLIHSGFSLHPTEHDLKNNWTNESHTSGWTTAFDKLSRIKLS